MRYAAYCRVSTGSEEQLSSLKNQRSFFEDYADRRGDTLVRVYADRGISGKSMKNRSQFIKLMEDSALGEFDAVLVKDISRFARNTLDFLTGIRTLKAHGVDVIFVGANQKVLGESEFVLTLFAALAQEESWALSKKIAFGKRQGARRGRVPNLIYGYDKADTYTLVVNSKEAEVVRDVFNMYIEEELGYRRIASALNSRGIPTKLGNTWESKGIKRILTNPIYKGVLVNNKTETGDFLLGTRRAVSLGEQLSHYRPSLAIVDEISFERAQERRLGVGTHRSG